MPQPRAIKTATINSVTPGQRTTLRLVPEETAGGRHYRWWEGYLRATEVTGATVEAACLAAIDAWGHAPYDIHAGWL